MGDINSIIADGATPDVKPLNLLERLKGWQSLRNADTANVSALQGIENAKTQNETAKVDLADKRRLSTAKDAFSLISLPDGQQTGQTYRDAIDQQVALGHESPERGELLKRQIPDGLSPAEYRAMATRHALAVLSPPTQAEQGQGGTQQMINDGQQLIPVRIPGSMAAAGMPGPSGPRQNGAPIQTYPSRSELAGQVTHPASAEEAAALGVPLGTPIRETTGSVLQGQGAGHLAGPANVPGGGMPNVPVSPANPPRLPQGGMRVDAAPTPTQTPTPVPPTPAPPAGYKPSVAGMAPGQAVPMEEASKQFTAARSAATNFSQSMNPLYEVEHLLRPESEGGKGVKTGTGQDEKQQLVGYLRTLRNTMPWTTGDWNPSNNAEFSELNKYMMMAAQNSPFAAGSDSKLSTFLSGSPNTHISDLANREVIKTNIAYARMQQAAYLSFKGTPDQWPDHAIKFGQSVDPRAFAADLVSKSENKKLIDSMNDAERKTYFDTIRLIRANPSLTSGARPRKEPVAGTP